MMRTYNPINVDERCGCWWNSATGYFEACCDEHEREFLRVLAFAEEDSKELK